MSFRDLMPLGYYGHTQHCSRRNIKPALLHRFEFMSSPRITQWFIRPFIFCGCFEACLLKSLGNGATPCPVPTFGSRTRNILEVGPHPSQRCLAHGRSDAKKRTITT